AHPSGRVSQRSGPGNRSVDPHELRPNGQAGALLRRGGAYALAFIALFVVVSMTASCKQRKKAEPQTISASVAVKTACASVSDENGRYRVGLLVVFDAEVSCDDLKSAGGKSPPIGSKWAFFELTRTSKDESRVLEPGSYAIGTSPWKN